MAETDEIQLPPGAVLDKKEDIILPPGAVLDTDEKKNSSSSAIGNTSQPGSNDSPPASPSQLDLNGGGVNSPYAIGKDYPQGEFESSDDHVSKNDIRYLDDYIPKVPEDISQFNKQRSAYAPLQLPINQEKLDWVRNKQIDAQTQNVQNIFKENPELYNNPENRDKLYNHIQASFGYSPDEMNKIIGDDKPISTPLPFVPGAPIQPPPVTLRKNPITGNQDYVEPTKNYSMEQGEAQMKGGVQKLQEAGQQLENVGSQEGALNKAKTIGSGLLHGTVGAGETIMGALNVYPAVAAFTVGSRLASEAAPTATKLELSPFTSGIEKVYGDKKVPSWAQDTGESLDFVYNALLFHDLAKGGGGIDNNKDIADKIKNGDELTPKEQTQITKVVSDFTPKEADILHDKINEDAVIKNKGNEIENLKNDAVNNPNIAPDLLPEIAKKDAEHTDLQNKQIAPILQNTNDVIKQSNIQQEIDDTQNKLQQPNLSKDTKQVLNDKISELQKQLPSQAAEEVKNPAEVKQVNPTQNESEKSKQAQNKGRQDVLNNEGEGGEEKPAVAEPVTFKAFRYGDDNGDVQFSSKNKDYSEEYARIKGGKPEDVKEITVTANNPVTVELSPKEFSSPLAEKQHIEDAKNNGNDLVIFKDKVNGDEFYAKIKPNEKKPTGQQLGGNNPPPEENKSPRVESAGKGVGNKGNAQANRKGEPLIVTHPKSIADDEGRANGNDADNKELPNDRLTPQGEKDAANIDLTGRKRIYVSPNERTVQTADLAKKDTDAKIIKSDLFKTGDVSEYEGKPQSEFDKNERAWLDTKDGKEFTTRMEKAHKFVQDNPDAAFVTHSKVERALNALGKTGGKWTDKTTELYLNEGGKHGDVEEAPAAKGEGEKVSTKFVEKPLSEIKTDEKRFQNRTELDKEHVNQIVKNWDDNQLDPVVIWKDPKDGEAYLLAGHHRLEAAKQKGLDAIDARYFKGDEKAAIEYAKEKSNANRAMETDSERASIYRKMRADGAKESEILKAAEQEGKNQRRVYDISGLNPKGDTMRALKDFEKSNESKDKDGIKSIAQWIGAARNMFPKLTDAHENEMFHYLFTKGGIEKVNSKLKFLDLINRRVNGLNEFNPNEPINFEHKVGYGSNELGIRKEIQGIESENSGIKSEIKKVQKSNLEKAEKATKLKELSDQYTNNVKKIADLEKQIKKAGEADKKQTDIFSQIDNAINDGIENRERANEFLNGDADAIRKDEPIIQDIERQADNPKPTAEGDAAALDKIEQVLAGGEKPEGGEQPEKLTPKQQLRADLDAAKEKFNKKRSGELTIGGGTAGLEYLTDVIKAYVKAGISSLHEIIKNFREDNPEYDKIFSDDDIKNAYGKELDLTGIKNATVDFERELRGDTAFEKPLRRDWTDDVLKDAFDEINSGRKNPEDLAAEIAEKPRPLSDTENAILTIGRRKLQNDHIEVTKEYLKALETGDDARAEEMRIRKGVLEDKLRINDEAAEKSGTALGRGLASRKMMMKDDFSLAKMTNEKRVALGGRELTPEETKHIQELHDKIEEQRKKIEDYEKEREEARAKEAAQEKTNEIKDEVKKEQRTQKRRETKGEILAERNDLKAQLKAAARRQMGQVSANPFDAEMTTILGKLAKNYVKDFFNETGWTAQDIIDAVYNDAKELIGDSMKFSKREVSDAISGYGKKREYNKDELDKKVRQIKEEMRLGSALEDVKGGELPKRSGFQREKAPQHILDMRQQIKDIIKEKGLDNTKTRTPEDAWKAARKIWLDRKQKQIDTINERIANKDFATKPKKVTPLDKEMLNLNAEYEKAKKKWEIEKEKDRLAGRNTWEKIRDGFIKTERALKLSGITSIAKLSIAALTRLPQTTIEEGFARGVGKLGMNKIFQQSPRYNTGFKGIEQGNFIKTEAKAYTAGFTDMMKRSAQLIKSGKSNIDFVYGKRGALPPEAINFFGHLHSVLKSPAKESEFSRSFEKRTAWKMAHGVDVTDPLVEAQTGIEAYKDANRAIFMQDNVVNNLYRQMIRGLETQKIAPQAKGFTDAVSTALQWLVPFVKVPTNIVGEVGTHAIGLERSIYQMTKKGIQGKLSDLSPEEADAISRNFIKGSIGTGLMALGWGLANKLGGFYTPGAEDKKQDVKSGHAKIMGHDVPTWALENAAIQALQVGATAHHLFDYYTKENIKLAAKGKETEGKLSVAGMTLMGITREAPLAGETIRLTDALFGREQGGWNKFEEELAKSSLDPMVLQNVSEWTDKDAQGNYIERKPQGDIQAIETGIPGLREKVPSKGASTPSSGTANNPNAAKKDNKPAHVDNAATSSGKPMIVKPGK